MTDTPQKKTLGLEYIRRRSREVRSQHQNVRSTKAFKKHLETGRSWDGFCCMLLLLLLVPHVLATMHGRNRLNSQPEGWTLKIHGRHADEGLCVTS